MLPKTYGTACRRNWHLLSRFHQRQPQRTSLASTQTLASVGEVHMSENSFGCRVQVKQQKFQSLLSAVKEKLAQLSATLEQQAYVADVLTEQHQQYCDNMTAENDKRRALLKYIDSLEV